ncbi:chloramphenicol-biosynthetic FADH2-dependent halogenase CmlS [Pseudomonas sp. MSSRFD41]|uniref:chloramphenicol-biosynthetic FADH2-dependent halogenase CmlS n=1 Tax=unclassified Pseudomonas TaxID=196821 RepID=UPI00163B08C2|nr:chloramphenicol-biosynthetic FADH2-dependent halogenase CmlS [Pseudomonas sp. MSSRFD41]MBC2657496.1 chloramphenicol-biosynthetic FADH2-dependent halogenase CmlS [Pseudomonas sp. MSSRFD41]
MLPGNVVIIGGGPAGSVAALTLLKLGHTVTIYEKETFPRYRIGESFLPGTMSIFNRLGLQPLIDEAQFVKKPSATFLWGQNQPPWTFSFSTPKSTAEWVFDHAIQVKREVFDHLLLKEVMARGGTVHEGAAVTHVDLSDPERVTLEVRQGDSSSTVSGDYLIDASGANSVLARQLKIRRYDEFYRNLAVWSYFSCPDPFQGDLRGTTFSITFEDGWVWMIPLEGDIYSVGVIVDISKVGEIKEVGPDEFYKRTLAKCVRAKELLGDSQQIDQVRVVRDWSYDTSTFSSGRFFLCGDAACFTDPLFSQGVHLASQSAVCAASAIDYLSRHPSESPQVHEWYKSTYGETYEQYHEFLASFYTYASFTEPDSEFWSKRRIVESEDDRFNRRQWFDQLCDKAGGAEWAISDFKDRASTMIALGRHQRSELSDEFSDAELTPMRVGWIGKLLKQLSSISEFSWNGGAVTLQDYYKVNPLDFKLEPKEVLSNGEKRMTKYAANSKVREIFSDLIKEKFDYKTLIGRLNAAGYSEHALQMVIRLFEAGLLSGKNLRGEKVHIQDRLRFDGVGIEYEV